MGSTVNKRSFERVSVRLSTRLLYNDTPYPGLVMNLSEKGMFISTKLRAPEGSVIEVDMPLGNEVLIGPFRVKRRLESGEFKDYNENNGLACETINRSSCFDEYIKSLK